MSEQIKRQDVSEKDIYAWVRESAELTEAKILSLNNQLIESSKITKEILSKNSKISNISEIKAVEGAVKQANQQLSMQLKLEKELARNQEIANKARVEEIRLQQAREKNIDKFNAKLEKESSLYHRLDGILAGLTKEYRELGTKKALFNNLTQTEEKRLDILTGRLQKYDGILKLVDANTGKGTRTVGLYSAANARLSHSVNQLTREMPAFANSVNTGFMAISNNLPMFFDEIGRIKQANIELAASGKPTLSVFGELAKSIFSFQTLLSVGVTLLTVYGGKIIDFIFGETQTEKATKKRAEALKKASEESRKAQENIFRESSEYVGYILALKQTNKGSNERSKIITEINNKYGTTLKNLADETKFQAQLNKTILDFIAFKKAEFQIRKNEELITKNLAKRDILQNTLNAKIREQSALTSNFDDIANKATGIQKLDDEISALTKALDASDKRLQSYGFHILENNRLIDDYGFKTEKATKKTNDHEKALKDITDQINKRFDAEKQLNDLLETFAISDKEKQLQDAISDTQKEISETGDIYTETVDRILDEEEGLKKQKIENDYQEKLLNSESNEEIILARQQRNIALIELDDEMSDKRRHINDDFIKTQSEFDDRMVEENKKTRERLEKSDEDSAKKRKEIQEDLSKSVNKLIKEVADYYIEQSEKKIQQIDKEISAAEKQYDHLKALAETGNITAKESLAEQQKIINDANKKKLDEQKRIERIKLTETALTTFNAKVENGDKTPLISTISEITLLRAFINSLPSFEKGTKDTGETGAGLDGKGGYLAVLHKKEKVFNREDSAKIGYDAENSKVANVFQDYKNGKLVHLNQRPEIAGTTFDIGPILKKFDSLEKTIQDKPTENWDVGKITDELFQIIHSVKKGNNTVKNYINYRKR